MATNLFRRRKALKVWEPIKCGKCGDTVTARYGKRGVDTVAYWPFCGCTKDSLPAGVELSDTLEFAKPLVFAGVPRTVCQGCGNLMLAEYVWDAGMSAWFAHASHCACTKTMTLEGYDLASRLKIDLDAMRSFEPLTAAMGFYKNLRRDTRERAPSFPGLVGEIERLRREHFTPREKTAIMDPDVL